MEHLPAGVACRRRSQAYCAWRCRCCPSCAARPVTLSSRLGADMIDADTMVHSQLLDALTSEIGADGVLDGRLGARPARDRHHVPPPTPTGSRRVPHHHGARLAHPRPRHRAPHSRHCVRSRDEPRGGVIPTRGGISLISPISRASRHLPGQSDGNGLGRGDPPRPGTSSGPARPLLPRRSGRGTRHWRHGRHQRSRDDNGALRQVRQMPRVGGRARRRPHRPTGLGPPRHLPAMT